MLSLEITIQTCNKPIVRFLSAQCLRLLAHSFDREYTHVCVSASESKVLPVLHHMRFLSR